MKHPNVEKVFELATMFLSLHEATNGMATVNLMETDVPKGKEADMHPCKTTACHAGWFGFMQDTSRKRGKSFMTYTQRMGQFLGFKKEYELTSWAKEYPMLWGNTWGRGMFAEGQAFGKQSGEKVTLEDIGNHWLKVGERLETWLAMEAELAKTESHINRGEPDDTDMSDPDNFTNEYDDEDDEDDGDNDDDYWD